MVLFSSGVTLLPLMVITIARYFKSVTELKKTLF